MLTAQNWNSGATRPSTPPAEPWVAWAKRNFSELLVFRDGPPLPDHDECKSSFAPRPQGDVPCCTASAVSYMLQAARLKVLGIDEELSSLFLYWVARNGGTLRALDSTGTLLSAASHGVATAHLHPPSDRPASSPYSEADAMLQPSPDAVANAASRRFERLDAATKASASLATFYASTVEPWKRSICAGLPIVFTFHVTDAFVDFRRNGGDLFDVDDPEATARATSLHCVALYGYDDRPPGPNVSPDTFAVADSFATTALGSEYWRISYRAAMQLCRGAIAIGSLA